MITNETIKIKVKQRLNKLASNDYDNITDWQIVEAFNKGVSAWVRRTLHGYNQFKEGDEANKRRIDDLQCLLKKHAGAVKNPNYYEVDIPEDYLEWKRITALAKSECCEDRPMMIYLAREGDVDELLRNYHKKPSFKWAETFCTIATNKVKVYTNGEFDLKNVELTYYKQPRKIQIKGSSDPYTGKISVDEVTCEFKDDLVELFIDETVKILAGDIESITANQLADNSVETNN